MKNRTKEIKRSIPKDYPVKPISANDPRATVCGNCGLGWDDSKVTGMTPVPAARCPFEYFHIQDEDEE